MEKLFKEIDELIKKVESDIEIRKALMEDIKTMSLVNESK